MANWREVRLHILLARDKKVAVVIRRGPSNQTCLLLWDRNNDSFKVSQWIKGRIYERRSDISPGSGLTYFYNKLKTLGFKETIISTDYKFNTCEQAARVLGAFFGEEMKKSIRNKQSNVVNEFTGVWIY